MREMPLEELRAARELTQTSLAKILDVGQSEVSKIEKRTIADRAGQVDKALKLLYSSEVPAVSMICRGFRRWTPRTNRMWM